MPVCTDNPAWGRTLLPPGSTGPFEPHANAAADAALYTEILGDGARHCAPLLLPGPVGGWKILARDTAPRSQYDSLIDLVRGGTLPHRLACLARTGDGFHGFRGRAWSAAPGNIHLTVHLAPERPVEHFHSVFTAMAAVAVLEAVDAAPGLAGQARIKWVNDVVLRGAKVAGVLAYTQTRGDIVGSVILGIGLNVEATPAVPRSPWVPAAGSLCDLADAPVSSGTVLLHLLGALDRLYDIVLESGSAPLLDIYRARSAIIGRNVHITTDDAEPEPQVLLSGRVTAIGDGLELHLEGHAEPVTRGRLVFADDLQGAT
jgi:biotin-[acetyl-CoA-carboxylase] ligase BirA-like protein